MINLESVLQIQTYSGLQQRMIIFIIKELVKRSVTYYIYNGCVYATKGIADSYPCVVAHMDTVHRICEDLTVIENEGIVTGYNRVTQTQVGIGGDDKVGVYIALRCLEATENIKLVFFRDEEIGCLGSSDNDKSFFDDVKFVLQCDRKGNSGFVTNASGTILCSDEFMNDVEEIISVYGYSFINGMMTDVMALRNSGIEISMANIECGYYNPHYSNEYVVISDVENCLNMVQTIINSLNKTYKISR